MKKLFLIVYLFLYSYISESQSLSDAGHFQGLTYYSNMQQRSGESEDIIYYSEDEDKDTVYIIVEKPVLRKQRPRIVINWGWSGYYNTWNYWDSFAYGYGLYHPYYGYSYSNWYNVYPYRDYHFYSYYRFRHHHHAYYNIKNYNTSYKVRSYQRSNISTTRKPNNKGARVSNSDKRIKQNISNSVKSYTKEYDDMYRTRNRHPRKPTVRIDRTKKTRKNTPAIQRSPRSSRSTSSYKPSRSNTNYTKPSRSSSSNKSYGRSSYSSGRSSNTRSTGARNRVVRPSSRSSRSSGTRR